MRVNGTPVIEILVFLLICDAFCYEKTLRKIVRNQSKMIQTPFSDTKYTTNNYSQSSHLRDFLMFPGYTQVKGGVHKMQRPRVSTILSSVETGRSKATYSKMKLSKNGHQNELRLARDTFYNTSDLPSKTNVLFPDYTSPYIITNMSNSGEILLEEIGQIPPLNNFPLTNTVNMKSDANVLIDNNNSVLQNVYEVQYTKQSSKKFDINASLAVTEYDIDQDKADFLIEEPSIQMHLNQTQNIPILTYNCKNLLQQRVDIDAQEKLLEFDIEPPWIVKKHFWNKIYDNRYESLMRNPNWPPLKVILIPRTHVDTVWKKPFHVYHEETVHKIITNMIKKLQFYSNLTFTWNEVSHLSQWWKFASQKRRVNLRRLVREGRLEITTGGWVETDEATSNLFGILHQFTEGHQWLHRFLKYKPNVAWLTNSVTHSPSFPYILSASGISYLVFTNIHFSWEQFFAEYQYSDFMWLQNWDHDKSTENAINEVLNRIGKDRYPKHTVLTHYLQFNSDGFEACGPHKHICNDEFNFANKILDINTYNVKRKSERLLEQYSKTGTTSPHNIIIAPIGNPFHFSTQTEFDYQYNNYLRISDFINTNQNIYKATVEFGTPINYFAAITERHKSYYPTLKGDFLNFADIQDTNAAYWTGYFTTRPILKILLRRLQATLRSTEILFTFTLNLNALRGNVSEMFEKLANVREIVARLQDRNVLSGTLPANMVRYIQNQILTAVKDCWYIQEYSISLLTSKSDNNEKYIFKYVYRDGEFISPFKSVAPGDYLYVFNSYSHERSELVELITRNPNIRVVDHNKKDIMIQINPFWKYNSDRNVIQISKQFYKIIFVIKVPPMTIELFKVKETYDVTLSTSTVYCMMCAEEPLNGGNSNFQFSIQPVETGDIQIENYKFRLIFDEMTGFLKTVIEKENYREKQILMNYGAFKSSDTHSGLFLFKANTSNPLSNIFENPKKVTNAKVMLITSGNVATDFVSIYGRLLQHTVQIYNIANSPLTNVIRVDSKVDYEASPKNRELEMFMSIQTDISNGNPPEIVIDNNGFQYTPRKLNLSRPVESNMIVMTSMAFIQDETCRLTFITDHAQGVTALQEGQIVVMLDRRVLFNDGRGIDEGLADSSSTNHVHYILLENLIHDESKNKQLSKPIISMPSILAIHLVNTLNYPLDIFFIDRNLFDLCYYAFLPLIQSTFACDVTVINFRTLSKRLSTSLPITALITLHRQSYSCQISYSDLFHCNSDVSFNLEQILQNVKNVYQTNLVGTSDGVPMSNINLINFPAMELITLKVKFR
ncbi:alpha-mannosidase 2-like [Zerene cesonia]|uniref:alpha-mannosidase 2-like n=1 Tax=Zerene cesonia TaxID=33412 RepID=UPI0018E52229|nr:alpha-mannosidase 2-like [Zerene cesonia]